MQHGLRQVVARPLLPLVVYTYLSATASSGFLIYCECERVNAWIDSC
jgi:hypothetical protein